MPITFPPPPTYTCALMRNHNVIAAVTLLLAAGFGSWQESSRCAGHLATLTTDLAAAGFDIPSLTAHLCGK